MTLDCGCPERYPENWHERDIDLSRHGVMTLPIPSLFFMPLAYEAYLQRQQEEINRLGLTECWPGFVLRQTGMLRGKVLRLVEDEHSPSRHFGHLGQSFQIRGFMHRGEIDTIKQSILAMQGKLLEQGKMPHEIYLANITCPQCQGERGGPQILLVRRWQHSSRLAHRLSSRDSRSK